MATIRVASAIYAEHTTAPTAKDAEAKEAPYSLIVFSLCSAVAIVITLAPGISILMDGLVIAFVLILNLVVWLKS